MPTISANSANRTVAYAGVCTISKVKGFVEGLPGNAGVVFLIDRDSSTALTLTL